VTFEADEIAELGLAEILNSSPKPIVTEGHGVWPLEISREDKPVSRETAEACLEALAAELRKRRNN